MKAGESSNSSLSYEEASAAVRAAVYNAPVANTPVGGRSSGPAAPSLYTILIPLADGRSVLAYNTASQGFARWDDVDLALWDRVEAGTVDVSDPDLRPFFPGGFVVSAAVDELALIEQRLSAARFDTRSMILTVAPTMGCNFACSYCFQGMDKPFNRMQEPVMDALVAYLDAKTKNLDHLNLTWYGGEPLMHREGIYALSDRIIPLCRANKCGFSSFIVTNGYFLDSSTAGELLKRGVSSCQVTLDGTAAQHDARRHLLSGKPTYERICKNLLEVVSETKMTVSIRVNVDSKNGSEVVALLDDLKARGLAGRPNFGVYFAPVEAITDACASCDSENFTKTDYGLLEVELYRAAFERGLTGLPQPPIFHGNCGAVRKNGLVLTPSGDLHKCWDTVQEPEMRIGTIFDVEGAEASDKSQAWLRWSPFENEVCRECPILPSCSGACAYKFIHPDHTHGEAGALPCPSWKFNIAERLFLRAEKQGIVRSDEWDPILSPTRAEARLKTGKRHDFSTVRQAAERLYALA